MKKLNFLVKAFSLVVVFAFSSQFSGLNAQSFINENAAVVKLNSKLSQLEQTPNATVSFPNGASVVGDEHNAIKVQYYSMILRALEAKDQNGNLLASTRSAYESTRDAFNNKIGNTQDPKSTGNPIGWLHNEALKLLTN